MQVYELGEFLRLSAVLHYQLSAQPINWPNILHITLAKTQLSNRDRAILNQVFTYLAKAYGDRTRRLGPLSVLHPIRSTALLTRASEKVELLDLITGLLHDTFEDIHPEAFESENWFEHNPEFSEVIKMLPEIDQWYLMERLHWLTKGPSESYYHYIGRLLNQSGKTPQVIRIKLADRLDNTLDMRIDLEDPLQGIDFFEHIFQLMFITTYKGFRPHNHRPQASSMHGAQRLYQLFKNIVLISLVRKKKSAKGDIVSQRLFKGLVKASIKEAQRIALHLFEQHEDAVDRLRELMLETMSYVQKGGIDAVTSAMGDHPLDGLFMSKFDNPDKSALNDLYRDWPLMIEATMAFIVIFLNFLNDPDYYVKGISDEGVHPAPKE
jgi:hypothetical protein